MRAIAPSILAADFSRLGELVREVEAGGAVGGAENGLGALG